MTLAIATMNPDSVAETYVRQHMRLIAPGKTVGIAFHHSGTPSLAIPFFHVQKKANSAPPLLNSLSSILRTGYSGALPRAQEASLAQFLEEQHGVKTILAEFGPVGCALRHFCRAHGIKLFVNFHGFDATVMPKSFRIRHAYRLLARDGDGFLCGSEHFKKHLISLGFQERKISVIPCGIEIQDFPQSAHRDPSLVVGVGRFTEKKAPNLTIRAFSIARKAEPNLKLHLIGDGPLMKVCNNLITELGLLDCVRLYGAKDHDFVKAKLRNASIFVQHSVTASNGDQESQGISLAEAMASGIPVVATDHNGFSETVMHGQTGFLSPERDVAAMSRNIVTIARSEQLRRVFGHNGRIFVEKHLNSKVIVQHLRAKLSIS